MDFRTFYQGLTPEQRHSFATKVGTSVGYCHQIAYGTKRIELGLADAIVAASGKSLSLDDLPLTERATFQRTARTADSTVGDVAKKALTVRRASERAEAKGAARG